MTHAVLLANLLTSVVVPIAPAAGPAPAPPAAAPERSEAQPPLLAPAPSTSGPSALPEIGLGALQLAAGYLAGIAGPFWLLDAGVLPKTLQTSDVVTISYFGLLAPALASAAVWGTGQLSARYRGHFWKTMLGAYVGAALGILIGVALEPVIAPALGVDSDPDVPTETVSGFFGALMAMPIGAVAGWHISKQEIAQLVMPTATAQSARDLMLPLISLRW